MLVLLLVHGKIPSKAPTLSAQNRAIQSLEQISLKHKKHQHHHAAKRFTD